MKRKFHAFFSQFAPYRVRKRKRLRGNEIETDSIKSKRLTKRMDGPTEFEIPCNGDLKGIDFSLRGKDRIEVDERLSRMLIGPISCVDHRLRRCVCSCPGGSFLRVADDDKIGIRGDDADGVDQGFPLLD